MMLNSTHKIVFVSSAKNSVPSEKKRNEVGKKSIFSCQTAVSLLFNGKFRNCKYSKSEFEAIFHLNMFTGP